MATLTRRSTYLDHHHHPQLKRTRSYATFDAPSNDTDYYLKPNPPNPPSPRPPRPVLIPIHPHPSRPIRKLPSLRMLRSNRTPSSDLPENGSRKRKRGPSGENRRTDENLYNSGGVFTAAKRLLRGTLKRSKSAHGSIARSGSGMDLDESGTDEFGRRTGRQKMKTPEPEPILEEQADVLVDDDSDDYYISSALPWQLQKLRKEDLLRLYRLVGLEHDGDDEEITKNDIVNAMVQARKKRSTQSSAPTSSKRRAATSTSRSSPPTSASYTDGGNDAGAEDSETNEEKERKRVKLAKKRPPLDLGVGYPAAKLTKSASVDNTVALDNHQQAMAPSRKTRFASNQQPRTTRQSSGQQPSALSSPTSGPASSGDVPNGTSTSIPTRHTRSRKSHSNGKVTKDKHVEFSEEAEDEGSATEPDTEPEADADGERTPTRQKRTTSTASTPFNRSTSLTRAALTRSESARVYSPKKLRKLPSRMNLQLNTVDGVEQPLRFNASAPNLARTRTTSFTRPSLPRKAKPGGSLKEDSSSEDPEAQVEEEEEEGDDGMFTAEEGEEDELEGEGGDDVFLESASLSQPKRDGDANNLLTPISIMSPEGEESDLTELSDDEGEEVEEEATADEVDPDETPRPRRTTRTAGAGGRRKRSRPRARMTRSRSQKNLAGFGRPACSSSEPEDEEVLEAEDGDEETEQALDDDLDASADEVDPAEAEEEADGEGQQDQDDDAEETETVTEGGTAEMEVEPRVLRNGKVVGEVSEAEDEEGVEEGEDDDDDADAEVNEIAEDDGVEGEGGEEEGEGEEAAEGEIDELMEEVDDDPDMEDDYDLSDATAKSLARLRRDDLVRLCETRDLEAEGTKNQLVENLLQWRSQQATTPSSSTQPSSFASTVRAPSTSRPIQPDHDSNSPVLLRSHRVHVLQPATPDPDPNAPEIHLIGSKGRPEKESQQSDELELDLESLGLEDREIPAEKLTKLEKIGSGGFKDVYIGKLRGRKVAIAEFRGHLGPMDIKELKLLRDFNHPNVVRFLGVSIPENTRETPVMMVSELCSNGDLFDYVRNVPPPSLRKVLNLMLDVARGINYLHNIHQPSIIHRDCKSSNILITSKVTAKIADFGLAKVKQSTRSMVKSLVGTVNWQAPELWHAHPKYDHKVDVFSCAMVFWEMLQWHSPSKKYPWEGMNEHAIYEEVGAKKHRPSVTGLRKAWCPEVVQLVERMWAQDPKERPPIAEVVEELEAMIANH